MKSFLVIHISLNALREDKVDPPIQQEISLFLGAISFNFRSFAANFVKLLCNLSANLFMAVVPPATIKLLKIVFLKSISHFIMELYTIS